MAQFQTCGFLKKPSPKPLDGAWTRRNPFCNATEYEIVGLNFRQQHAGELAELLVILLIAHRFQKLNSNLGTAQMVIHVSDERIKHCWLP